MSRRAARPDGPADRCLARLRAHGLAVRADERRLNVWRACCPVCRCGWRSLTVRERGRGGRVDLSCDAMCSPDVIRATLRAEPAEVRIEDLETRLAEALDLADAARDIAARSLKLASARAPTLELVRTAA
jgi:hypothetical protein